MNIHRHHRKRRSQGGDDSPNNIILVPDQVHNWIHQNPEKAYELGWMVESWQDPAQVSVAIPKELVKPSKPRKTRAKEKARDRAVVALRVPQDEREDGAGILDDLLDQVRERLAPELGLAEDCPYYFVLVPILHDWLTNH